MNLALSCMSYNHLPCLSATAATPRSSRSTTMVRAGCIDCNSWRSSKSAFVVELSVEDIQARELETNGR
jgi:hypothetical protein